MTNENINKTTLSPEVTEATTAQFGVAAECGLGRRPTATIPALLHIHREVSAPLS